MSNTLWSRAQDCMPGGVNSPVRAFGAVGGTPVFIERAEGAWLFDSEGNAYLDLLGSWGPMIFGHGRAEILEALHEQLGRGVSFGACTEAEVDMAEAVRTFFPSMEMLRLVNSGTEATLSAVRVARGFTGRSTIVKFRGCYHGHGDSFLIQAGSGALTHGVPSSLGVTQATADHTLVADFNRLDTVEAHFQQCGDQIACVIVEPIAGNMGVVPPALGFLSGLRELCDRYGALLIFDEVMTGFRVAPGGAQELYSVRPDLTTLGKIIGGGLPMGAYGGRREIMQMVSPMGGIYQAGTLSGNPLAVRAGLTQLALLRALNPWPVLEANAALLCAGLAEAAKNAEVEIAINRVGSMFTVFFHSGPVLDSQSALSSDTQAYARFFHGLLEAGVYAAPAQFEALFLSLAHGPGELQHLLQAAPAAFAAARG